MESHAVASSDPVLPAKILKKYLVDEWKSDEARIKLKPIKNDSDAFCRLFDPSQEAILTSNLSTINIFAAAFPRCPSASTSSSLQLPALAM